MLRDQLGDMVRKYGIDVLIIETPKPRGLPTAADEMETLVEVGRFIQKAEQLGLAWSFAFRTDIKVHITGRSNTGDSHVRQALLDRFGGEAVAIGGKRCKTCQGKCVRGREKNPCDACQATGLQSPRGELFGMTKHAFAAAAVLIYWLDVAAGRRRQRIVNVTPG